MTNILTRLRQPSTLRGVAALLGLLGFTINDAIIDAVSAAIIAGIALYDVIRNEVK